MNELPQNNEENIQFKALHEIYLAQNMSERNHYELSGSEETTLRTMALTKTKSALEAQAILYGFDGSEYATPMPDLPAFMDSLGLDYAFSFKADANTIVEDNNVILLYPNPAQTTVSLNHKLDLEQLATLELYDLNGRLLSQVRLEGSGVTSIDVSHLPTGVYYYQVVTNGKALKRAKLAITR